MHIQAKLCMFFNDMPATVVQPESVREHTTVLTFPAEFVPKSKITNCSGRTNLRVQDPSLKTSFVSREDVGDAFLHILFDAYGPCIEVPAAYKYFEEGEDDAESREAKLRKYVEFKQGAICPIAKFEVIRRRHFEKVSKKNIMNALNGIGITRSPKPHWINGKTTRVYSNMVIKGCTDETG